MGEVNRQHREQTGPNKNTNQQTNTKIPTPKPDLSKHYQFHFLMCGYDLHLNSLLRHLCRAVFSTAYLHLSLQIASVLIEPSSVY